MNLKLQMRLDVNFKAVSIQNAKQTSEYLKPF